MLGLSSLGLIALRLRLLRAEVEGLRLAALGSAARVAVPVEDVAEELRATREQLAALRVAIVGYSARIEAIERRVGAPSTSASAGPRFHHAAGLGATLTARPTATADSLRCHEDSTDAEPDAESTTTWDRTRVSAGGIRSPM